MVNTINEARTPGELAAWLRQWADGADTSDHLDDNDARQLADGATTEGIVDWLFAPAKGGEK